MTRTMTVAILLLVGLAATANSGSAQQQRRRAATRHAPSFFELTAGTWQAAGADPADSRSSQWPLISLGVMRGGRGHLGVETSVGLWRRSLEATTAAGLFDGSVSKVTSYVVPLTVSGDYFLLSHAAPVEPFLGGGVGIAMSIDHTTPTGSGAFPTGGTTTRTGLALHAGGGVTLLPGARFGVIVRAGYLWTRFGDDIGASNTTDGFRLQAGVTVHRP